MIIRSPCANLTPSGDKSESSPFAHLFLLPASVRSYFQQGIDFSREKNQISPFPLYCDRTPTLQLRGVANIPFTTQHSPRGYLLWIEVRGKATAQKTTSDLVCETTWMRSFCECVKLMVCMIVRIIYKCRSLIGMGWINPTIPRNDRRGGEPLF